MELKKHVNLTSTDREFGEILLYIVKKIEEDLDFGCEERSLDAPVMAVVTLVDADGKERTIKMEDALLYNRNINEGDKVYFDTDDILEKALDAVRYFEDWNSNSAEQKRQKEQRRLIRRLVKHADQIMACIRVFSEY